MKTRRFLWLVLALFTAATSVSAAVEDLEGFAEEDEDSFPDVTTTVDPSLPDGRLTEDLSHEEKPQTQETEIPSSKPTTLWDADEFEGTKMRH